MKRFLITTSDEQTWRRDRPVLLLGEWCRLYNKRASWEHLDAEVAPYHWDDRQKYHEDYSYLQSAYEELLRETSATLNEYHGTSYSTRYWRILIGPWLYLFTQALFDRWTMIQKASDAYDIDGTFIRDIPLASTIAPDLQSVDPYSVVWNQYLFGRAIEYQNRIPWERLPTTGEAPEVSKPQPRPTRKGAASRALHAVASSLLGRFTRSNEAMVIRSYLPRLEEMKLQLTLGQVPKLWRIPPLTAVSADAPRRGHLKVSVKSTDMFFRFLASMIPLQIPTVYLEGYQDLRRTVARLPWPSTPKVIFTSTLFQYCEVFQEWAATKTEAGCPFVIGQHGGYYGVAQCVPGEDHQVTVSDRFLTWGWKDARPETYPAFVLTNVNKPLATWNPLGNLLLVATPMGLFSHETKSRPVGPNQSAGHVGEHLRFALALDEPIRASLTVRIDQALDEKRCAFNVEQWKEALPGVEIDPSIEPIEPRIRRCRLFVYTYNSTGFLETLARNIPTLMFWNPRYFELRPSAQPYYDLLAKAGIYHDTPESAAQHVTRTWPDVAEWWNQPAVQQARRTFCEQYAFMPPHPLKALKKALTSVSTQAAVRP